MLKKEYEVLVEFCRRPWKKFTFREIKELSGKSSGSYVYNSLKGFVKEGILSEERAGNVVLYCLNLASLKSQAYAGFASEYAGRRSRGIPYLDIERIASRIPAGFYILLITGSYARGMHRKDSDLDLVIICDDGTEAKKIYAELRHECEINIPKIHLYVFRKSEFSAMLLERKSNYGKEIARSNLILAGGEEYYRMIGEAIQNGFSG